MQNKPHKIAAERLINLAKEFSPYPAGRYRKDGPYSGEAFREDTLVPLLEKTQRIVVNIDGVAGLPSSFWEEVFGGLIRRHQKSPDFVKSHIVVRTTDKSLEPYTRLAYKFAEEAAHK